MKYFLRTLAFLLIASFSTVVKADEIDSLIEQYSTRLMSERFSVTVDTKLSAAVESLFNELVTASSRITELPKLKRRPKVTVIVSNEINAYSIPGGDVYITTGLCGMTGTNGQEVSTILAHELAHGIRRHAAVSARKALAVTLATSLVGKDWQEIASLLWNSLSAAKSRSDEFQADRDAWAILNASSVKSSAALAMYRRLGTLQPRTPDVFEQLFATHPPIAMRAAHLKDWLIESTNGWNFSLIGRAQAADNQVLAEFANDDPAWQAAYTNSTGWQVYSLANYFANRYKGECTWLAWGLRRDEIPLNPRGGNNAVTWPDRCKANGYAVGTIPKPGSIAVWDSSVGGGAGHVAMVAEVLPDNFIRLWDSNWGPEAKDANTMNGRIRHRICSAKGIVAYIYWPNGQTEAPEGYPGYQAPQARRSIMLIDSPFALGDEDEMEMVRFKLFSLSAIEVQLATSARLRLKVRSLPAKDPIISINRVEIGRIVATNNDWQTFVLKIPAGLLRANNLLDIETFIPSVGEGYDDCEIKEVELLL